MHTLLTFRAVLALIACFAVYVQAQSCAEDRCLKKVQQQASSKPNPLRQCRDFLRVTYIPAPTSSTTTFLTFNATTTHTASLTKYVASTISSTATFPVYETASTTSQPLSRTTFQKRRSHGPTTTSATAVPPYASGFCANTAAYSSACSCIGAKRSTTTADARTITVSSTVTETKTYPAYKTITTTTVLVPRTTVQATYTTTTTTITFATAAPTACPQPQPTFKLRVYASVDNYDDTQHVGEYAMALAGDTPLHPKPDHTAGRMVLVGRRDASNFTRAADCALVSLETGGTFGLYAIAAANGDYVYFGDPASFPAQDRVRIGFASDSKHVYMEANTDGRVLGSLVCLFDYFYGSCTGVFIGENDDYGYDRFERILV